MGQKLIDFIKNLAPALNALNMTSLRIHATIVLASLTAVRYLFLKGIFGEVTESIFESWLIFLAVLGGLDVTQFIGKRKTYVPEATTAVEGGASPRDISIRRDSSEHKGVEPSL